MRALFFFFLTCFFFSNLRPMIFWLFVFLGVLSHAFLMFFVFFSTCLNAFH